MKEGFLIAASALLAGLLPLLAVGMREPPVDGLVALELAGATTTLALVCVAVGTGSSSATGVALLMALLSWVGGLLFARFLDRTP
ncbi:monovalent cation/H+ antiporter complex subunit F [Streptomyces sp. MK5]|uniref:MrpF/PhaF family protein n=1 Tax=Streptomyces sp. MK5 TaxID=3064253 RepID=UPI0027416CCB|nr:monovalent cation/H+ antiporter complex subunit F [Streptomyces sp. MK5]